MDEWCSMERGPSKTYYQGWNWNCWKIGFIQRVKFWWYICEWSCWTKNCSWNLEALDNLCKGNYLGSFYKFWFIFRNLMEQITKLILLPHIEEISLHLLLMWTTTCSQLWIVPITRESSDKHWKMCKFHLSLWNGFKIWFRQNIENDKKRDDCIFKDETIRMSDADLDALVNKLPQAIMDKEGLNFLTRLEYFPSNQDISCIY